MNALYEWQKKVAQAFCGSLTALYVQTPGDADMNAEDTVRLQENMRLAQQLGAEIVTTHGEDVPTQIAEYARLSDVTKIVIGRSGVKRRHFWSKPMLTEQLIALAPKVDIHIIPDAEVYKSYRRNRLIAICPALPTAWELLLTVGILAAATIIGWVFLRLGFADANIIMVYLLGVLLTSAFTSGYICGVLSAFLSVILFNYFLTEPRLSLVAYGSKLAEAAKQQLFLYDAETDADLDEIAETVGKKRDIPILAGCAGFAAKLPELLKLPVKESGDVKLKENLVFLCGSVNPITKSQIVYGEKMGIPRIHLKPEEKLEISYWDQPEGLGKIRQLAKDGMQHIIIDSNDEEGHNDTMEYAAQKGYSIEDVRVENFRNFGLSFEKAYRCRHGRYLSDHRR